MVQCFPTVIIDYTQGGTRCMQSRHSTLRGLLGVGVHVLRVSQQTNPLLLLPLFGHLKSTGKKKDTFSKMNPPFSSSWLRPLPISLYRSEHTAHNAPLILLKSFQASSSTLLPVTADESSTKQYTNTETQFQTSSKAYESEHRC